MKIILSLLAICVSIPLLSAGKMDSKVTTGVVAYNKGDYEKALASLDTALSAPDHIRSKNLPRAYYYRAQARMKLLHEVAMGQDMEKLELLKDSAFMALDDLLAAKKYDDGKWGDQIENQLIMQKSSLLQGALTALNLSYDRTATPDQQTAALRESIRYSEAVLRIDPDNYIPYDLLGQARTGVQEYELAMEAFQKATELYSANLPEMPDMTIAYAFYRQGMLLNVYMVGEYEEGKPKEALARVQAGLALLDSEKERIEVLRRKSPTVDFTRLEDSYQVAKKDLETYELDLYRSVPELKMEALKKFQDAIEREPDNYIVHIAYASLMETENMLEAIRLYKKAIAIDDAQETAHFNLGALYNNISVQYQKAANEEADFEKADELMSKAKEQLLLAKPHFEKALLADPKNRYAIQALMQIAVTTDDMEAYKELKAKREALGF